MVNASEEAGSDGSPLLGDSKAAVDALLSEWKKTGLQHEQKMQVMEADTAKTIGQADSIVRDGYSI
jgi:hypothetical protein